MRFSRICAIAIVFTLALSATLRADTTGFGRAKGSDPGPLTKQAASAQTTTVAIIGSGDVGNGPFSEVHLSAPAVLTARADTSFRGAAALRWELRAASSLPGTPGLGGVIEATGGSFRLPLAQLLPAKPPVGGETYVLRARALGPKPKSGTTGTTLGTGGAGSRDAIGPWSAPALILYGPDTNPPVQFGETAGYHRLQIRVDRINLITGQMEINKPEDFHVMGFASQLFLREVQAYGGPRLVVDKPAASRSFGPVKKDLNPPQFRNFNIEFDPYTNSFKPTKEAVLDFDLTPLSGFIRSRFFFAVSVMERDGGGQMQEWMDGMNGARDVLDETGLSTKTPEQWGKVVAAQFEGFAEEIAKDLVESALKDVSPDPWGMIWGTFRIVATMGIAAAVDAQRDDYYGTKTIGLDLMFNMMTDVHALGGKVSQKDGKQVFTMKPFKMRFLGIPAPLAAATWDGQVELIVTFEFSDLR